MQTLKAFCTTHRLDKCWVGYRPAVADFDAAVVLVYRLVIVVLVGAVATLFEIIEEENHIVV